MWIILVLAFALVLLIVGINVIVEMARSRGRSVQGWVLLSLFISPIFVIFILFALGETNENRIKRIVEEEKLRELARKGEDVSQILMRQRFNL